MKKIFLTIILALTALSIYAGASYTIYLTKGIVKDNSTGLYWARCSLGINFSPPQNTSCLADALPYSWSNAIEACENLEYGGRTDWRLPSIKELQSIVKYNDPELNDLAINNDVFPGTMLNHYWSSTTHKKDDNLAWTIDFTYGNITYQIKTINGVDKRHYVRCVAGP